MNQQDTGSKPFGRVWRRRLSTALVPALIAVLVLLSLKSSSVEAFGQLQVRIGGFAGACLPVPISGLPFADPLCPDKTVIAGAATDPHGASTLGNNAQSYEDRFVVNVANLRTTTPNTEPVVFEYRAPEGVFITGMAARIDGVNRPCEIGTELDPPEPSRCQLGQLRPTQNIDITIEYVVGKGVARDTILDHDVRAFLTPAGTEELEPNNQDHYFTSVTTRADLSISKIGPKSPVPFSSNDHTAGKCETYTITVTNNGPSNAQKVLVGDQVNSPELSITDAVIFDNAGGTCTPATTFLLPSISPVPGVICDLGEVIKNDSRTIDVTVCADSGIPDGKNFVNIAAVGSGALPPPFGTNMLAAPELLSFPPFSTLGLSGPPAPFTPEPCESTTTGTFDPVTCAQSLVTPEPLGGANVTIVPINIETEADLEIDKTSEPDKVYAGEQKTYTIKVTNNGPSDALNVTVKDTLPDEVDYEIDDDACIDRERALNEGTFGYVVTDSRADPFLGRGGIQNDFKNGSGNPTIPLPLPYLPNDPGEPFFDISGTGTPLAGTFTGGNDDGSANVGLGFDFQFYDLTESSIWVSTNGYLKFGSISDTTDPDNDCPLTESTPNRSIFAFWDDLDVSGGNVYHQTFTNPNDPPNRVFVVQWDDVTINGTADTVTFQVQLYEGSNQIRIVYGDVGGTDRAGGSSATVGIDPRFELVDEDNGGITYACGDDGDPADPFLDDNLVVVFNPQPDPDEAICTVGEKIKEGSLPAGFEGAVSFATGDIIDFLNGNLFQIDIGNTKQDTFADGSSPTHVMKPGEMRTFEIRGLVDPATPPGTVITNTAVVTGFTTLGDPTTMFMEDNIQPFGGNNMSFAKNLVLQKADLRITKFGKPDGEVRAGDILTYTIVVDNFGPSWADNVAIKDILQSSGTFDLVDIHSDRRALCNGEPGPSNEIVKATPWDDIPEAPPPFEVDDDTGVPNIPNRLELDCTLNDDPDTPEGDEPAEENTEENRLEVLEADGPPNDGRWILTLRVRARQTQDINNTVEVVSDAFDPDTGTNNAFVQHDITDVADLSISKTDTEDPATAGETFDYTITVENDGPSTAENVVVVDTLPLELSVVEISQPGDGSCGTVQTESGNQKVTCDLGNMGHDTEKDITITVLVDPDVPDGAILWNQAIVFSDIFDPNNQDNITRARTRIEAESELEINKDGTPDPVTAGEIVNYRIEVTNNGPSTARNVTLQDLLGPSGQYLTFVGANFQAGSGFCYLENYGSGPDLRCNMGDLQVGTTVRIDVQFRVDPATPDGTDLENEIRMGADSPITTVGDLDETVEVDSEAELTVTKTPSDNTPVAGTELVYTIAVTNNGPSVAWDVLVEDDLFGELTYLLDTFGCGESDLDDGTCNLGDLKPGETITFDVVVEVESDAECGSTLPNTVRVEADNAAQATDAADVVVECASDLLIRKFGKPDDSVLADEDLTYYVVVTNLGPSDTVPGEVYFRDLLASDGTFEVTDVTSDRDTTCDSGVGTLPFHGSIIADQSLELECTLDEDLNPNEQWLVEIVVTAQEAQDINNVADVYSATASDPNPDNNHAEVEHDITDVADLSISKDDDDVNEPFVAGETFEYTITVTNDGPSAADNVVVMDTLPLGVKIVGISQPGAGSCGTVQGVDGNLQVLCTLGTIEKDEIKEIFIEVRVETDVPAGTIIWNQAVVTSDVFDPDNKNNVSRARSETAAEADLKIDKVDDPDPVVAGELLEYRISVKNEGPSVARDVVVTDDLPAGVTVVSAATLSGTGICQSLPIGFVTCDLGTMASGAAEQIVILVRVDPASVCSTELINVASVSSTTEDPNLDNNSDDRQTHVDCEAELEIKKTASTFSPIAGGNLVYTIEVTNKGPSVAEDVEVTDDLPSDVTYLFDTLSCGFDDLTGPGCELGDMAPNSTISFDVVVQVNPDAACRTVLTNTAEADADNAPSVETETNVSVNCNSDLRVLKFGKPDGEVRAGDILTYTVVVDNLGPSFAEGVFLKDVMQSSGTFTVLDIQSDRDATCTTAPAEWDDVDQRIQVGCLLDDPLEILEEDSGVPNPGRWILTMSVRANQTQDINNVADVWSTQIHDPDPASNRAVVEHDITDVADLSISKDDNDADEPFIAGDKLEYYISVTNRGPSTAENVKMVDTLPLGLTIISMSQPGPGSCATLQEAVGNQKVICDLGTMAVDTTKYITLEVRIDPDIPDGALLWNQSTVTSDIFDPDNKNNISRSRSRINTQADLEIDKADFPDPVLAGEQLEYTLEVTNDGPSVARDVVVFDELPEQVVALEVNVVNEPAATCSIRTTPRNVVDCGLGDMPPNRTISLVVTTRVLPEADAGTIVNSVSVSSSTDDPDTLNNEATQETEIQNQADLEITKSGTPEKVVAGEQIKYNVWVINNGPSDAEDVVVTDVLPSEVEYEIDTDACTEAGGTLTCTRDTLKPGEVWHFGILVRVKEDTSAGATIENEASVDSATTDPDTANNTASTRNFVMGEAELRIEVSDSPDPVTPGETLIYTVRVSNDGPSDAANVVVINELPADVTYDDAASSAQCDETAPGVVTCNLGNLAANADPANLAPDGTQDDLAVGETVVLTIVVDVNEGIVPPTDRLFMRAEVIGDTDDPNPVNNVDREETRLASVSDVSISKTGPAAANAGDNVTYTIEVGNAGPSAAQNVVVEDSLPAGLTNVSVTASNGATCTVGTPGDPNDPLTCGLGTIQPGDVVTIEVNATLASDLELGTTIRNDASVTAGTFDGNNANNFDHVTTQITISGEAAAITVNKTVSLDGTCPGTENVAIGFIGDPVTYCYEVINSGATFLDFITVRDTVTTRSGPFVIFEQTFRSNPDGNSDGPLAPGDSFIITNTEPDLDILIDCNDRPDTVEVSATPVQSDRTPIDGPAVEDQDGAVVETPCKGVDWRLQLPALNTFECETWIQVQNVGNLDTQAMVVLWGQPGACPPQSAGPIKVECTGLLRPGSAWTLTNPFLPLGAQSGIVYSLNATDVVTDRDGNEFVFADLACLELFSLIRQDHQRWVAFDRAYRERGVFYGPLGDGGQQLVLDFGEHQGEPLAVTVNRSCPDPVDPNVISNASYVGISTDREGIRDPNAGQFAYYAPLVWADFFGMNSVIHIQNSGEKCTSVELWFQRQGDCIRPVVWDILQLAPGESYPFDPNVVVGPNWQGSVWLRASQPLGMVIDTLGANHFGAYHGVPADVFIEGGSSDFSLGTQVNYLPLIYREHQGWETSIQVQNLSSTHNAKVKVTFLDNSGGIVNTVVDWICPRGSQTFFLPVIAGLPGNWVGAARIESQDWFSPGDPAIDAPRILSVGLLEKYTDPAKTARQETVVYNALQEMGSFDWQVGPGPATGFSGSDVLGIPLAAKGNRGVTSEVAIQNLNPNPGFTDFAIFIYDQNGIIDHVCEKLGEKQVEYIDLDEWGIIRPGFLGSLVISSTFSDQNGGAALGAVAVERIGRTQAQPDLPGDESKAFEAFPLYNRFLQEKPVNCPGQP